MVKRPKRPREPNQLGKSASGAAAQDGDTPVLTDPDGQFARNDNRPQLQFRHGLKDHPLFELPNLIALTKRPLHVEAYWSNGKVEPTDSWGIDRVLPLTLIDTIVNIGDNNSLVILKQVAQDPVYRPVLQDFLASVALSGEQMRQDVVVGEITISHGRRLQLSHASRGNKTLWLYDHNDPTLVSHEERAQYHMGNHNSIVYLGKPEMRRYRL